MGAAFELRLDSFASLSPQDHALIASHSRRHLREIEPRHDLVREGERPRVVTVILEGWACRYKQLPNGRRQIVAFLIPGDICASGAFVMSGMDHSIGAITRVKYAEIAPDDFMELMNDNPRILQALWRNELVASATTREWLASIGQRDALQRLSHLFCEMFLRLKCVSLTFGDSCGWPITQTELADATGLTPVHVNRTLQELRRRGLIETRGRRLAIPDLEALQGLAMFNANYLHFDRPADRSPAGGPPPRRQAAFVDVLA